MAFDKEIVKKHWIETSEQDQKAMLGLFDLKLYSYSLFIGHLAVEKYLKAIYVDKFNQNAPFLHNLFRLAELSGLELNEEISDKLDIITTFNIEARYDDYKKEFYKKCTKEFTELWIKNIREILEWLKLKH